MKVFTHGVTFADVLIFHFWSVLYCENTLPITEMPLTTPLTLWWQCMYEALESLT